MNTPNKLNCRLTTHKYGSLTASTTDPELNAELLRAAKRGAT